MRKLHKFTVTGPCPFPIDMLRYDSAWPANQDDSLAIADGPDEEIVVHLESWHPYAPAVERWASFGYEVSEVRSE